MRGSCGLLPGSPEEVAANCDAQGARAIASLFRSLRQPSMRVACLSELTGEWLLHLCYTTVTGLLRGGAMPTCVSSNEGGYTTSSRGDSHAMAGTRWLPSSYLSVT